MTRRIVAGTCIALLALTLAAPASAAPGDITEFPVLTTPSLLQGITAGPDGNLWFAERSANKIGRITLGGVVTEFSVPTASSVPFWIAAGPDGNLWFTEITGNNIGRIAPDGTVTEFPVTTAASQPHGIALGPDGNLWFAERSANRIGRITPSGAVTEFPVPTALSQPWGITAGPDGNLWFTEQNASKIGRITTSGQVTEFPLPPTRLPAGITSGPDGNLWFTERAGNRIGRITPSGVITEFPIPTANPNPVGIAAGPDGNLWFSELGSNKIGQIATDGTFAEFAVPSVTSQPYGVTPGPDGHTWFTESATGMIGRLELGPSDQTAPAIALSSPQDEAAYTLGQTVLADYGCQDEQGGSGLASCDGPVPSGTAVDTSTLGGHTFTVTPADVAGNWSSASTSYSVFEQISGSLDPLPSVTTVRAGSAPRMVLGMGDAFAGPVFEAGYPMSQVVDCNDPTTALGALEPATLRHDPRLGHGGRVAFAWLTQKDWSGGCRKLVLRFGQGGWSQVAFLVQFA